MKEKYYIKTLGCQMNESDSERIANFLETKGYIRTFAMEEADLIVVNACSVRQTAVDRIFGLKPKFKKINAKKILTGCILETDKKEFEKFFDQVLDIKQFLGDEYLSKLKPKCKFSKSAFVPIMTGCNNFCSYCVVPYTRGREVSRPVKEIIKEVQKLVSRGYQEITLLGQNVNSYKHGFAKLLKKINSLSGEFRIKFITNHPKDMSNELIQTITDCDKVVKEIHLPIQSGDNQILKKMNRGYTVEKYLQLVKKIRKKIPNVKLSTDVIVGFPGETKQQFQNTVKAFREINYDSAYINKYSPRTGTAAEKLKDSLSWKEKKRRWRILNTIANQKKKLIAVIGPTASGKSDLAVKLAKKFNGEVISADSRQVYKGMDIGTGKITKKETKGVPHHLLDVASPKRQFTVSKYKKQAMKAIVNTYKKNKIPILCGGTGFYIQAVTEGVNIPKVKPDYELRRKLKKLSTFELFNKLKKLDPRRAKEIDGNNRRRLIRALEINIKTQQPVPGVKKEPDFDVLYLGIKKPLSELKKLIKKRLLSRIRKGMIAEVKRLRKSGLSWKRLEGFGLEYKYIARYLQGKLKKSEMIEKLQTEIVRFAKRQLTWFKKYPGEKVHWIKNYTQAEKLVKKFLNK